MSSKALPSAARLEELLAAFSDVSLLVVGDVVLDEYLQGDVDRISPEAPVPVVHIRDESVVLGGAGNVVRNVVALGGRCSFCSVVGDDLDGQRVLQLLKDLGIDDAGVVRASGRPTTRKTRVVARAQQVLRFDRETVDPVPEEVEGLVLAAIDAALGRADGVVFEDYAKGFLTASLLSQAMPRIQQKGVPIFVDPKNEFEAFRGASLFKPNLREAEGFVGMRVSDDADLSELARRMRERVGNSDLVVTRGGEGMIVFEGGAAALHVRTATREVFDVQGAGDTIVAALALSRLVGASLLEAAILANAAAGVVVGKIGTATASPGEIRERLPEAIAAAKESS